MFSSDPEKRLYERIRRHSPSQKIKFSSASQAALRRSLKEKTSRPRVLTPETRMARRTWPGACESMHWCLAPLPLALWVPVASRALVHRRHRQSQALRMIRIRAGGLTGVCLFHESSFNLF